jgi:CRP-like cAMP-binding protein
MQVAEVIAYEAGDVIVREGDRGDELFIVLAGQVRIAKSDVVLLEIGPGDHFGEMALIRAAPRSATATAVSPSELIAIRRSDFFEILRKEPELAVKLLWQFVGVLADRLDQTSRDLSTAKQELAAEDISDAIFPDDPPLPNLDDAPPSTAGTMLVSAFSALDSLRGSDLAEDGDARPPESGPTTIKGATLPEETDPP